MRDQLLDSYCASIFALLDPGVEHICMDALVYAYPHNYEHMLARFNATHDFEETASDLWMMNMDAAGRERVAEYFVNHGVDTRFLDLVMSMYNNFGAGNYPVAWEIFNNRARDALALLRYIVDNEDEAAEECSAAVLAYLR
jgi:hypothetical protein